MSRTIPTINTSRVTLRAMRAEDFTRFAEIWAIPEVVTHISGKPRSKPQSWDAFLRNAGHWQISGFGQWAVQPHGVAQMAGQCGFFFGSRGLGDDFDPFPEAGWVLSPEAQGKGLGLDAVQAAHDWFDRVIAGRTVCMITPENTASLRIADALGYAFMREVESDGEPLCLMTRKGPPV
ncbi:GNAT family N-acetyltransferase [Sulfitobacter geojensis]|jgi:RimJ/RimL family protein N-acetyltransferase|uniref:GNAT family N-acetyltransferase n=1 Tax=Sulfitobacter geojensis TaxID=1342299 RepID=A0AAE3B5A9_9RHOB|nr:GNAT family protein [Sulfitobacter geojensis]MBM1688562.1 GNAT family N-acetyltransferase [Sulfitobacter geojensis]MBM1692629.1 GNAT family N-acetyltransferase [Sulfitobacter geojensis]MBM1704795.1 GNAT family N-acetyltransferase [Sulfitobacter geojensis]MBM1708853.1 GNAT family N-acetyltransferase [Sulfitobacter geojensis]MBM1712918.1 GNAT family N-acetyltransferase [Sulfitobacter geojensis]